MVRSAILAFLLAALASPALAVDPILDDPPVVERSAPPPPPPESRVQPPKKTRKRAPAPAEKPASRAAAEVPPPSKPPPKPPPKPAVPAMPKPAFNQVRLDNTTGTALNYAYRIGNSKWAQFKIPPGIYHMYTGADRHWISFDDGRKHAITYELRRGSSNVFVWRNGHWDLTRNP